jgi:hypothetical protein
MNKSIKYSNKSRYQIMGRINRSDFVDCEPETTIDESGKKIHIYSEKGKYINSHSIVLELSYPKHFPRDGKVFNNHSTNFLNRLMYYTKINKIDYMYLKKMEFSKQGAPHFHLLIVTDKKASTILLDIREMVRSNWNDIVRKWLKRESLDEETFIKMVSDHRKAGTTVELVKKNTYAVCRYMYSSYEKIKGEKKYQNTVPVDIYNAGRFVSVGGNTSLVDFGKVKKRPYFNLDKIVNFFFDGQLNNKIDKKTTFKEWIKNKKTKQLMVLVDPFKNLTKEETFRIEESITLYRLINKIL